MGTQDNKLKTNIESPDEKDLTDWENPPKLEELKQDYTEAQSSHTSHVVDVEVPDFEFKAAPESGEIHQQLHTMMQENPEKFQQEVPPEVQQAHLLTMQQGAPVMPVQVGTHTEVETKIINNKPTLEICDYNNVIIDPTCNGN